ncbi:MAG: hypothetical protein GY853_06480 [PVC group bacterium]|nr:hypothetical protein [PVC group bacterium]
MKKIFGIILVLLFFNTAAHAASLADVRAYVDKSIITIGEKITYTIETDVQKDLKVDFPVVDMTLGGFAIKDFGRENNRKVGKGYVREKQWYLLDTYTVGSYVIPEQKIKIILADGKTKTLKAPEIFVEVKSVMEDDSEDQGLRDIKAPLIVPQDLTGILVISVIVLLLCVGLGFLVWYYKMHAKHKKEIVLLPHEMALQELVRIENMNLLAAHKIKEYYYLVSICLRIYLEDRFALRAPEQTTEEFLDAVISSHSLEGSHINLLREYLYHCDMVKFAKLEPNPEDVEKIMQTTRKFIDETKEDVGGNTQE